MKLLASIFLAILLISCGKKEGGEVRQQPNVKRESFKPQDPITKKKEEKKDLISQKASKIPDVKVDFSPIKSRNLSGLYGDLLGVRGSIPASATVNFGENLEDMWHRKLERKNVSGATIENSVSPIATFVADNRKMTLKQFVAEADKEVKIVLKNFDFTSACSELKLSKQECKVFEKLSRDTRGIDLVAYGMTELLPSAEGDLNVKVMDILLRNAGSNYLFAVPALYDKYLSLGLYQFTSLALCDCKMLAPTSRVNRFLKKEYRIPGSVIKLRNGENHRAAMLFAMANFANLSKQTSDKEFEVLKKALKSSPADLVVFVATAHHAPGLALSSALNWLRSGGKRGIGFYLKGRLKPYGKKTYNT